MNKLLLVGINARYTHLNLAIRYLRNHINDLEYKTEIIEFSINQNILEILEQIAYNKPEILAFSVYIWNTDLVRILLPEIKNILPDSKIIMGGPEVSYNPKEWLKEFPEIDFIICGAGETGFRYLLENNLAISNAIIRRKNPHFSEIPFPYLPSDFPEIKNKYIYYESSRGCSFKCSYCLSSRSDQALEFRDIENVKKELAFLIKQNPKIIKFVDRTFNAKKEHSREIWKFLIELNPKITLHFEVHPELIDEKDLQILKNCPKRLFQFEIGIQSTNPETLKAIHRVNNWQKTSNIIKQLTLLGNIHIHVDLIAGLPFETMNDFEKSFNDIFSLNADNFQLGFLKVLPGTEMAENTNNFGIVSTRTNPYIILKNNWLSFEELSKLHKVETLLDVFSNSNKFKMTLKYLIPKFDTPFLFFDKLLKFLQTNNYDLQTKNWKKNAFELLQFIKENLPDDINFFFDCLRWDWCLQARSHYYPEFLRCDNDAEAKKEGYALLNSHKIKDIIKVDNIEISVSELKKVIYFIPKSNVFKQQILSNYDSALFVNGRSCYLKMS